MAKIKGHQGRKYIEDYAEELQYYFPHITQDSLKSVSKLIIKALITYMWSGRREFFSASFSPIVKRFKKKELLVITRLYSVAIKRTIVNRYNRYIKRHDKL